MARISTLADIEALEATPLDVQYLAPNTYEAIFRSTQQNPSAPALIFFLQAKAYDKAVTYSYRNLLGKIHQTANLFHELGVGPADTVSCILPNLPQTCFTLFGGEAAGVVNPIDPTLDAESLAATLNAVQTKVLVTPGPFPGMDVWEKVATLADHIPSLQAVVQVDIANFLSGGAKLQTKLSRALKKGPALRVRVLDFDSAIDRQPSDRLVSGRVIGPDEIAACFHTGGTTGSPKLARHTHFNQVYNAWATGSVALDSQPGDRSYLGLPLFHSFGAVAVGLGAWSSGACLVLGTPQGFQGAGVLENFWEILAHYRCTTFGGLPAIFKSLLPLPVGSQNLGALKLATCSGAPLSVEMARQFTETTGIPILEGYGLTEGTAVSSVTPRYGTPPSGAVGMRLPYQDLRTAVLKGNNFVRFCAPGEVGIVVLLGPNLSAGYTDASHNQRVVVQIDGNYWLNTGDLGRLDENGYLWLTGRKTDLIQWGGHNIGPRMLEEPLMRHPAVALTAAVARPHPQMGAVATVYVELKPGSSASADDLLVFARQSMGERAAVLHEVRILDVLPLTSVGKIDKLALYHAQVEDVLREEVKRVPGVISLHIKADGNPDASNSPGTVAQIEITTRSGVDPQQMVTALQAILGQYPIQCRVLIDGVTMG